MRDDVVKWLKPLNAVSVENTVAGPGTPDVNYVEGWIELKSLEEWPKREDTPLRVDHYTPQQKVWAVRRRRAHGRCHLLLKVGQDWLLLDGAVAARELGKVTKERLMELAEEKWVGAPGEELLECLRKN